MKIVSFPLERLFHGNENWLSNRAIGEVIIYCDLVETLQERIETLETRGKSEEASLGNVQAVISSYAFEIAMKSLWALDNSPECVKHTHNLLELYDELKHDTKNALSKIGLTRNDLVRSPNLFSATDIQWKSQPRTLMSIGLNS